MLLEVATARIERHVLELSGRCIDGLLRRGLRISTRPEPEFALEWSRRPLRTAPWLSPSCVSGPVDVWTDPSATLLRIDPHVFHDPSDIERVFDGLYEFRQTHGTAPLQSP